MIIALTGTPGTGKTSVSKLLIDKDFEIINLNKLACRKEFIVGLDKLRNSKIVDINKLNIHIFKKYSNKNIIIEGHLSHLLNCAEKIIVLRCHPDKLRKNLIKKGWKERKIKENVEAEILDIILCEAVDKHSEKNVFEIDVTNISIEFLASLIIEIINKKFNNIKKYKIGKIDWSNEILKNF